MLQNPRSKLAAWSKMHKDVLSASQLEGNFRQHFILFPDFYDRICFSAEIPFQKCAGCHTSCEQQKSYGKNPVSGKFVWKFICVQKALRQEPLDAVLVISGRRVLIFFCLKVLGKI